VRRRVLDLCLLAYPRARRERDRDYLRDLALDLADRHGFLRQALSLLRGGLGERIEVRRRGASRGTWIKRVVVACFVLAALALAANGLIRPPEGDGEQIQQIEQFACVYADHPPSKRNRPPAIDAGECAQTRRLVAARERGGWDCTTRRRTRPGRRSTSWECARGSEAVAWLGL
jgi:hypothetical protein